MTASIHGKLDVDPAAPEHKSKAHRICDQIRASIASGAYGPGERIPSEEKLGAHFGTTRVTVAKALNELRREGLVERRRGSGTYVARDGNGRLRLGLLVPGLGQGEIFEPICSAIAAAVQSHDALLVWGHFAAQSPEHRCEEALRICRQYVEQRMDGIFFAPVERVPGMADANRRIAELLDGANIPVVLLDSDVAAFPERSRFDLVGIDNRRVGYVQTRHLIAQGAGRIDYVAMPDSAPTLEARIAGYRQALCERDGRPAAGVIHRGDPSDAVFLQKLLRRSADAFVCGNDHTAALLMAGLIRLGIRIPRDVRVVGVDDLKHASLLSVPLTTVRQPCEAIGLEAVRAMLSRLRNPAAPARDILVSFELIARESSGCGPMDAHRPHAKGRSVRKSADAALTTTKRAPGRSAAVR